MDDIMAANPGIDYRILSIDQEIIIPLIGGDPITNLLPTATPIPLQLSEVTCYPNQPHSFWCISTLDNSNEDPLEAVSVVITLWDGNNELIETQPAFSALNLIPTGAKFPLAVDFKDFTGDYAYAMVSPVSAFPARSVEERFVPIEIIHDREIGSEDLTSWLVKGRLVSKDESERRISRVAILVTGLDEGGEIVGFRKLKLNTELGSGEELSFETEVFSFGPPIHRIEIYAEAPVLLEEN
jgi:hypothetical protein